jgi:YidC/Oxa1 family membrane protein insertase
MVNIRLVLWGVLAALVFLCYQTWQTDYAPTALPDSPATAGSAAKPPGNALGDSVPQSAATPGNAPAAPAASTLPSSTESPVPNVTAAAAQADGAAGAPLHVVTDVLDLEISLKGGGLDRADLPKYPQRKDTPNIPVRLLATDPPNALYELQSGLTAADGQPAPTHLAVYTSPQAEYRLADGQDELRVPLSWSGGGLNVTKTFVLKRGQYGIDVQYEVKNEAAQPRKLASYTQILRHWEHASRSYFDVETFSFKGPAVYDGSKSKDLNVESDSDKNYSGTFANGWLAALQHQFVSIAVPPAGQVYQYQLTVRDNRFLLNATGPQAEVPANGSTQYHEFLYVGPKLQSQLAAQNRNLERTVDFGVLTVVAQPLFTGLNFIHSLIGNWGFAIILMTACIKLLFYPLSQASGRSMARMRSVQPRMKQIQETYKDDREKLGRAMMELYKKEKINPLAGCLPMVVQIPVFLAYYRVLLESVEMRQAPFLLWINDLSSRDPYFVLPIMMGGAMFAQFKMSPTSPDPTQAKVMQFMPLVMTAMMAWFPSGLVVYWFTNTVLSILQQWRVNKIVEAETNKRRD